MASLLAGIGQLSQLAKLCPSFPGTKVSGTFVPGTFRSRELSFSGKLSFPGPFVLGNFPSQRTKVPGNFRSWDLWYPGTFVPIIR